MGAIVKVRNVKLGDGMPKICIPVTDTNLDDLKKSVNLIRNTPFDLIEWRADFYTGMEDPEVRIKAMTLFRNALGNIPVLFTIRTSVEGGMLEDPLIKFALSMTISDLLMQDAQAKPMYLVVIDALNAANSKL